MNSAKSTRYPKSLTVVWMETDITRAVHLAGGRVTRKQLHAERKNFMKQCEHVLERALSSVTTVEQLPSWLAANRNTTPVRMTVYPPGVAFAHDVTLSKDDGTPVTVAYRASADYAPLARRITR